MTLTDARSSILTNTKYIWSSVKAEEVKSDKNKSFPDEKNKTHLFLKSLHFLWFSIENKKPDQKNWKLLHLNTAD